MSNILKYKGFKAEVDVNFEDNLLVGKVMYLNDYLFFHAKSINGVIKSFHRTIDDYIDKLKDKNSHLTDFDKTFSSVKRLFNNKKHLDTIESIEKIILKLITEYDLCFYYTNIIGKFDDNGDYFDHILLIKLNKDNLNISLEFYIFQNKINLLITNDKIVEENNFTFKENNCFDYIDLEKNLFDSITKYIKSNDEK